MSVTRIKNNQIYDSSVIASAKVQPGSITGNLFAPTVTINSNITVTGNLSVYGNTSTLNSINTYINDPVVTFNNGYTGSLTGYDMGMLINRNFASLNGYSGGVNTAWVWSESDGAFEAITTNTSGNALVSLNNTGFANVVVGNITANSLTLSTGAFIAADGIQATPIGNVTPSFAYFTSTNTGIATISLANISNQIFSSSGTVQFGSNSNVNLGNTAQSISTTTGALTVAGGVGIAKDLYVGGNIVVLGASTSIGTVDLAVQDSIIDLHTYANLGPLTSNDGRDIGIQFHYYDAQGDSHGFLGRQNSTGYLEYIDRGSQNSANVFTTSSYGTIKAGNLILANTTFSSSTTSGALVVAGGVGISGNLNLGSTANLAIGANINSSMQSTSGDVYISGAHDSTLIWTHAGNTYDQIVLGNSATTASLIYGAKVQFNTSDSMLLPVGTNAQRPSGFGGTDTVGMFRYNTSIDSIEWYTASSGWSTASTVFTIISDFQFNGDGVTEAFTLSGASSTTAGVIVSINGVVQIPTLAYAVTGGSTLTFTEAPANGDVIDVRVLTTTQTISSLSSTNGSMVLSIDNNGIYLGTASSGVPPATTLWNTSGAQVSNIANVVISSAGTPTTIDTIDNTKYRSAKYIIQTTSGSNYQVEETLVVQNGTTATQVTYGLVQTNGNLGVVTTTVSGSTTLVQFTASGTNNYVRIKKDYINI